MVGQINHRSLFCFRLMMTTFSLAPFELPLSPVFDYSNIFPAVTPCNPIQHDGTETRTDEQRNGFNGERWWSAPDKEPKGKPSHHQNPEVKIPHSRGRPRVVHTKNQSTLDAARFARSSLVHYSSRSSYSCLSSFCWLFDHRLFLLLDQIMWTGVH